MSNGGPSNEELANVLERIADLLEVQDENPFRIRAYRQAAANLRGTDRDVAELVRQGDEEQLQQIPNVGEGIAGLLAEYVRTGRSDLLQRLVGEVAPEEILKQVPGIGDELARRVIEELDVRNLEALEQAAHNGRLAEVRGFGDDRVRAVRLSLAGLLSGAAQSRMARVSPRDQSQERPDLGLLLEIDEEYRRKAEAGKLKQIAPKRFNPENEAWLPILNTERKGWDFTALYSNTAQAHELGKTHDWVVIYYDREGQPENQATVVTEMSGPLEGRRVVRGREAETKAYYESRSES
ncbi:MAG: helix-hairpin-helix domain-containing protein [Anaerolineales bacterium]